MPRPLFAALPLLATVFLQAPAAAQLLLESYVGARALYNAGRSLAMDGDTDGDGTADLVYGAHGAAGGSGRIYVQFSSGRPTYSQVGPAGVGFYGFHVAFGGDVNGDGYDDILAANLTGTVRVLSGRDMSTLHTHNGTSAELRISRAGDTNADGYDDYLVADSEANGARGRVTLYSGRTHTPLRTFDGAASGDRLGAGVAAAGDVDRDGFDDVLLGAPGVDAGAQDSGQIEVRSGLSGSALSRVTGQAAFEQIGHVVCGIGVADGFMPSFATSIGVSGTPVRGVRVYALGAISFGFPAALQLPGAPGCVLHTNGLNFAVQADARGVARFGVPVSSSTIGIRLTTAWAAVDPRANALGLVTSDGIHWTIGG